MSGFLGKLTLQIPWKNLYTEPTHVKVEDLHLLVKPNADIKYNEEKEEMALWEKKKREIQNIEVSFRHYRPVQRRGYAQTSGLRIRMVELK